MPVLLLVWYVFATGLVMMMISILILDLNKLSNPVGILTIHAAPPVTMPHDVYYMVLVYYTILVYYTVLVYYMVLVYYTVLVYYITAFQPHPLIIAERISARL